MDMLFQNKISLLSHMMTIHPDVLHHFPFLNKMAHQVFWSKTAKVDDEKTTLE
jgi:hypothetical protein